MVINCDALWSSRRSVLRSRHAKVVGRCGCTPCPPPGTFACETSVSGARVMVRVGVLWRAAASHSASFSIVSLAPSVFGTRCGPAGAGSLVKSPFGCRSGVLAFDCLLSDRALSNPMSVACVKQNRLAIRGVNRRRDGKAHGRKVPGEVNPGLPDSDGQHAGRTQNLTRGRAPYPVPEGTPKVSRRFGVKRLVLSCWCDPRLVGARFA